MGTKPDKRKIKEIVAAATGKSVTEEIVIPTFQRSLEWTDNQKKELFASLSKGYPIGALLLYKDPTESAKKSKEVYFVIDGLQRISAMKWYSTAPLLKVGLDSLNQTLLGQLTEAVIEVAHPNSISEEKVGEILIDWLRSQKDIDKDYESSAFYNYLCKQTQLPDSEKIKNICRELINDEIRQKVTGFQDLEIPVLIFEGPREELAYVFKAINTSGTKLSLYDVLNAVWEKRVCKHSHTRYQQSH